MVICKNVFFLFQIKITGTNYEFIGMNFILKGCQPWKMYFKNEIRLESLATLDNHEFIRTNV